MLFSCCLIRRESKGKNRDSSPDSSRPYSPRRAESETQTGAEEKQVQQKWIPGILKEPSDRNRSPNHRNVCTQTPRIKGTQTPRINRRKEILIPDQAALSESESENLSEYVPVVLENNPHLYQRTTPRSRSAFQLSDTRRSREFRNSNMSQIPLPRNIKVLMTEDGPSRPLKRHDRVVWIDPDGNPEHGMVKWLGTIDGEPCAGLKLDSGRKVSFRDLSGAKVYPNTSGARATVPIKRLLLEKDYAVYSGIRFECTPTQRPASIPLCTFIPRKRRSLEPGIELITPIKKVGLEGGCDMEMGTELGLLCVGLEGTGLDLKCWASGAQVYIRETKEMVEILERRLRGKHLLVKVIYLDQSDTPGRVVEMYLSRLMSIGYLVEKDPTASPVQIPLGDEFTYAGNDYAHNQSPIQEASRKENVITPTPSAPNATLMPERMKGGGKNYHEYHAYPPSKRIMDMGSLFFELHTLGLTSPKDKPSDLNNWAQHGAKFSPGKPPIPWGYRNEAGDGNKKFETGSEIYENLSNVNDSGEHGKENATPEPELAVTLKPTPERNIPKQMTIDEPDRAAVVGVRQAVLAFEAKGLDLSGR